MAGAQRQGTARRIRSRSGEASSHLSAPARTRPARRSAPTCRRRPRRCVLMAYPADIRPRVGVAAVEEATMERPPPRIGAPTNGHLRLTR